MKFKVRQKGQHRKHGDWCYDAPFHLFCIGKEKEGTRDKRIPKTVRCPKCNKRLKPHVYDCEDFYHDTSFAATKVEKGIGECIHVFVPAHKPK